MVIDEIEDKLQVQPILLFEMQKKINEVEEEVNERR